MDASPRLRRADRRQLRLVPSDLESLLPEDHIARSVWAFVERLDLTPLLVKVRATEGNGGAPATDPAILVALWLLATLEGVGSARHLAKLCEQHVAYQWICGGVGMNHHTLSDFRVGEAAFLDGVLVRSVVQLVAAGVAQLETLAQDGRRTRASAGAPSFRSRAALERLQRDARERVSRLSTEVHDDPAATTRRQAAARQRAAEERLKRIEQALSLLPEAEATKERNRKGKKGGRGGGGAGGAGNSPSQSSGTPSGAASARVSTTDPEATVMKMPDGGYRPAYNVQSASDIESGVVVAVDVSRVGSDGGQLQPMVERVREAYGRGPRGVVVDGGYVNLSTIQGLAEQEEPCLVYAPPPQPRSPTRGRYEREPRDPESIAAWRERMGTEVGKALYRRRSAAAEWVNAGYANRGLNQFRTRGHEKARAEVLWQAIAHNFQVMRRHGIA